MIPLPKELAAEWGLNSLSEQERAQMIERIGRLIYQAILVRSLDILSHTEQEEFDRLLDVDTTTPEDVLAFLAKKIPTFSLLLKEEVAQLKADIFA